MKSQFGATNMDRVATFFRAVPILQIFLVYPFESHRKALRKFFALWIISLLPIILAALIFPPGGSATFQERVLHSFSSTHQFIYAVSFLAPMLYLLFELYDRQNQYIDARKRSPESLGPRPKGIGFIVYIALIVFIFTSFAYGAANASPATAIHPLQTISQKAASWVYIYGLICWYITILMPMPPIVASIDYVGAGRQKEEDLKRDFQARIEEDEEHEGGEEGAER
jgi:hypothetical protein